MVRTAVATPDPDEGPPGTLARLAALAHVARASRPLIERPPLERASRAARIARDAKLANLTPLQRKIYDYIAEHQGSSLYDIAAAMGNRSGAARRVQTGGTRRVAVLLESQGLLRHEKVLRHGSEASIWFTSEHPR